MKAPTRRHRMTLDLQADSIEELIHAIEEIQHRLIEHKHGRPLTVLTSGGCGAGYHIEHTVDEAQTAEQYREQLQAYVRRER